MKIQVTDSNMITTAEDGSVIATATRQGGGKALDRQHS
jgi:hypothetical protein